MLKGALPDAQGASLTVLNGFACISMKGVVEGLSHKIMRMEVEMLYCSLSVYQILNCQNFGEYVSRMLQICEFSPR